MEEYGIDPEGLKDISQLFEAAKGLIAQDIAIGVGKDLKTAAIACIYCMNQKGSQKPVIYQPNMMNEIGPDEEDSGSEQDIMGVIAQALDQVRAQKHTIEQLREVNPEAYDAIKGIIQALIVMSQGVLGEENETETEQPTETTKAELEKAGPGPVRRTAGRGPRRRLVAGSIKAGKRKVMDPLTGTAKWVTAAPKRIKRFTRKPAPKPAAATPPKPSVG